MSKGTKIWVTIGIIAILALILSIRDITESDGGVFFLSLLNLVGIIVIFWLWRKPSISEDDVIDNKPEMIKSEPIKPTPLTINNPIPKKQSEMKVEIIKTSTVVPTIKPSINNGVSYEQQMLELLRDACFPKNFMEPYDYEKVKLANELYTELQTDNLSSQRLYSIRRKAIDELGVSIDASFVYEDLISACNPNQFMEPYDATKVAIANELYHKVLANKTDFAVLEQIRKEGVEKGIIVPLKGNKQNEHKGEVEATIKKKESINDIYSRRVRENERVKTRIVGKWIHTCGSSIRIIKDNESNLYSLEIDNGNDWVWLATLRLKEGETDYYGSGTCFINSDDSHIMYQISKIDSSLKMIDNGKVKEEYEYKWIAY